MVMIFLTQRRNGAKPAGLQVWFFTAVVAPLREKSSFEY